MTVLLFTLNNFIQSKQVFRAGHFHLTIVAKSLKEPLG